jgi:hypothetical protein
VNKVETLQAVEKGSSASLRSIASLQRIGKYASARRFLARLASEAFLNSLNLSFSTLCLHLKMGEAENVSLSHRNNRAPLGLDSRKTKQIHG